MGTPLFSCVVPVKGERPFFDETMESLRMQGLSYEIVDHHRQPQPRTSTSELEIIVQDGDVEPDAGQSDALNRGFAKARGEWLFWLNADDVLLPGALRKVAARITNHQPRTAKFNWMAGNTVYLDADGRVRRCSWNRGWKGPARGLPVRVGGPSAFFRRELFEHSGGFDLSLKYAMDTDLWGRFRSAGHWPLKLPFYVWGFRDWEGSRTSGSLHGRTPPDMKAEHRILDARHGVSHWRMRFAFLRFVRLLNGSLLRTWLDSRRLAGKSWRNIGC